ncbi:hypothetical protein Hanom_Chr00s001107g01674271 [Helianthus anomalus]
MLAEERRRWCESCKRGNQKMFRNEKARSNRERVEVLQKGESLEIYLEAEKLKSESVEEAHKVSQTALNVAQDNYAEVQTTIEPLFNNLDWLQNNGIVHVANSILNSAELDRAVAALTVASQVEEEGLRKAEENYENLSLPVMDLVSEALKHDDYMTRLKAIFEPPETVELTYDDDGDVGDGNAE